jgi:hypothetical protein
VSMYRSIAAQKARAPVSMACALLGVSRSGFYDCERRVPSDRAFSDASLIEQIKHVHREHRGV